MRQTRIHSMSRIWALLLIASLTAFHCAAEETGRASKADPDATKAALNCQSTSNCVNSLGGADSLPPLRFTGSAEDGKAILMTTLAAFPEARLVTNEPLSVETVFTTMLGFRDQVLFRIDAAGQRIDFRSSSNFGRYDFGKNRSRMKAFAARFEKEAAHGRP